MTVAGFEPAPPGEKLRNHRPLGHTAIDTNANMLFIYKYPSVPRFWIHTTSNIIEETKMIVVGIEHMSTNAKSWFSNRWDMRPVLETRILQSMRPLEWLQRVSENGKIVLKSIK